MITTASASSAKSSSHLETMRCLKNHRLRCAGFTLAEAAISVGIAAMVIVSIVGLLPFGLDTMHQSALISADARIVQAIIASYQMKDWSEVLNQQTGARNADFYFDYQGMDLTTYPVQTSAPKDTSFIARAQVTLDKDSPLMPGSTKPNTRLKQVVIKVVSGTDPKVFDNKDKKNPVRFYRMALAQMDNTP